MKMVSELNGKMYDIEDCCFFRNYIQSAYYRSWGCELVDLFVDGNMKWVFVFKKSDHFRCRERWNDRNKEKDNG